MTDTANLGLPFVEGSQAQKHITHNDALRILDAVIQIAVIDMAHTTPPGAPAEGERYVAAAGATGAWVGHADAIATWQGGTWTFLAPKAGWCLWSIQDESIFTFDGTAWQKLAPPLDNLSHLGINTTASSPNLLSVKSDAVLFAAIDSVDGGSGDARVQISKEAPGNTASVFFSDNYSGRAEFGLTGDDDFRLKVSSNGASWEDAFVIDKATANVSFKGFTDKTNTRVLLAAAPIDALAFSGMQVNGGMEVSQENGSNAVTVAAPTAKHIIDGISILTSGTMVVVAKQDAAPSGMPAVKSLKISVTTAQASLAASNHCLVDIPIEGYRVNRLLFGTALASPVSLGFWFQGPAGTYSGAVQNGNYARSYVFGFTVTANTPTWVAVTVPGDTSGAWAADSSIGLRVFISLAFGSAFAWTSGAWVSGNFLGVAGSTNGVASTANTFYIGNVIVLPGIELPPADRTNLILRPYDAELSLCQRYYVETTFGIRGYQTAGLQAESYIYFPTTMRAAPTTAIKTAAATSNCTYTAGDTPTTNGARLIATATATGAFHALGGVLSANARL